MESLLPWCGLPLPVLLAAALWRRSAAALAALLLSTVVWLNLFGGLLADPSLPGGDLTVACHHVEADNPDPAGTARALAASGADVLALEELTGRATGTYEKALATAYPYRAVLGTVGLWSRLPLSDTRAVDIGTDQGPGVPGGCPPPAATTGRWRPGSAGEDARRPRFPSHGAQARRCAPYPRDTVARLFHVKPRLRVPGRRGTPAPPPPWPGPPDAGRHCRPPS
ncbi:endonuclease/exonuclease/phosphatase family protein [Streptomyces sp. NPDC101237]|uniref:endonuclease/exonuclease/phosphatase family protein n=1 Tax=Streptomyces sp. NPDC101237 TaxID=3366139 RepID=UPI003805736E